ncbi:hypothetical protein ACROYT_G006521 [Oculina patagonica]
MQDSVDTLMREEEVVKADLKAADELMMPFQHSWYQVWAVNPYESVCAGETVSFEVETTGADDDFFLLWFDPNGQFLDDSEQYSLNVNKTVLTINNALPPHAGMYTVEIRDATYNNAIDTDYFHLEVPGI